MRLLFLNSFVLFAVSVSTAGNVFAKNWAISRSYLFFGIALLLYMISAVLWLYWLPNVQMSAGTLWWQSAAMLLTVLLAIFYFKERVTLIEMFAFLLISAGIIILNMKQA